MPQGPRSRKGRRLANTKTSRTRAKIEERVGLTEEKRKSLDTSTFQGAFGGVAGGKVRKPTYAEMKKERHQIAEGSRGTKSEATGPTTKKKP